MIKAYWTNLDKRQQYLVACCAAVVAIALFLELAFFPWWEARAKLKKSIATHSRKIEEMAKLDAEFSAQESRISGIKQAIASRSSGFTLFSYLEKKAIAAGVKGSIKQMNSMQGAKTSSFEETLMDMKLEKITIKQLADFLYQVEMPAELIRIKRITVSKMKESPDYLSAQLLIASYLPISQPGGR